MIVTDQLLRLFQLMNGKSQMRIAFGSKKSKKNPKFATLPENVWDKVLDYLSPLEAVKMRRVNQKLKNLVEKRRKRLLYADFLRSDVFQILPEGISGDGEFFRHPKNQRIIAHEERRSILIIADTHWSASDAHKMVGAIKYYGEYAHTITLDASLAELCVAAQSTSDISFWFAFQSASATTPDQPSPHSPRWLTQPCRTHSTEKDQLAAYSAWTPRTQLIPIGPLFPHATELTIRSTAAQLPRLRRFPIYRSPLTRAIIDVTNLNALRLVISTSPSGSSSSFGGSKKRHQPVQSLKLSSFLKWANSSRLGHRFSVQFV